MATDKLTVNPDNDEDDGQEEEQESEPPVETSHVIVTSPNDQNSGSKMKKTRTSYTSSTLPILRCLRTSFHCGEGNVTVILLT